MTKVEEPPKREGFPLKATAAFSIVAITVVVLVWFGPFLLSSLSSLAPPTHEEFVDYALSLINSDRQGIGLQNVTLSGVDSGQRHAEELLKYGFLGHWDTQGFKPYMRYTLAGGKGAVSENCAWMRSTGRISDVLGTLKDLEHIMMYDDASSDWGHRDNILNAFHNKVSIGVAYDYNDVYLVQDFEDDYVSWSTLSLSDPVIMEGTISIVGESISQVVVYFDNPTPLTSEQLNNSPYNGSYGLGTYVGLVVPSGWEATEGMTITATAWNQTGADFQIAFDLAPAFLKYGKGVYTLCIWTESEKSLTTLSVWN